MVLKFLLVTLFIGADIVLGVLAFNYASAWVLHKQNMDRATATALYCEELEREKKAHSSAPDDAILGKVYADPGLAAAKPKCPANSQNANARAATK